MPEENTGAAYAPTQWTNRAVERPHTYTLIQNVDGTVTLIPSPGEIIRQGTPISAENMNHMETGISGAYTAASTKIPKLPGATEGNIPTFDASGSIADSGVSMAGFTRAIFTVQDGTTLVITTEDYAEEGE